MLRWIVPFPIKFMDLTKLTRCAANLMTIAVGSNWRNTGWLCHVLEEKQVFYTCFSLRTSRASPRFYEIIYMENFRTF